MSTVDRLKRLTGETASSHKADERQEKISELRRRIEQILERRPYAPVQDEPSLTPVGLEAVAQGMEVATPHGRVFVATAEFDLGTLWGRRRLREMDEVDMGALALLAGDSRLASLSPSDALFLDIETTGLAGGTGTLAFLIGLGWLEEGRFVTRLIVARDFTEEAAALYLLAEMVTGKKFLVSFNGKTFDLGILVARYILNRLSDPFGGLPHLDLLHSSRRLLGHRLDNSRLATLEQAVLGLIRDGDLPSSEIPQRYFRYLRTRDARLMAEVLEHNRLDIISMAVLTVHLVELLQQGHKASDVEPADVVAAARLHARRGTTPHAERLLQGLLTEREAEVSTDCGRELSLIWKRSGRWHEAASLWRRMLEADPFDLFAAEELAKWLEHRQMRFDEAIEVVERALQGSLALEGEAYGALMHRLMRLKRKAGNRGSP